MAITREYIKLHDVNSDVNRLEMSGYCPISVKEEMNKPALNYLDEMNNTDIFLCPKNVHYMTYYLVALNERNKTGVDKLELAVQVPGMMLNWAKRENLNDFEYAYGDILLILEFLNEKFLVNHAHIYDKANIHSRNVFHVKDTITEKCDRRVKKRYDEMTADDYKSIDVWQDDQTYTYDKLNRYGNAVPMWQKSMNIRHYDRDNDGLHTSNPERASLDNQVHGYNMNYQIKGSEFYQNYYYENI